MVRPAFRMRVIDADELHPLLPNLLHDPKLFLRVHEVETRTRLRVGHRIYFFDVAAPARQDAACLARILAVAVVKDLLKIGFFYRQHLPRCPRLASLITWGRKTILPFPSHLTPHALRFLSGSSNSTARNRSALLSSGAHRTPGTRRFRAHSL